MTDEERKDVARECVGIAMRQVKAGEKALRDTDKLCWVMSASFIVNDICRRFRIENPLDEEE